MSENYRTEVDPGISPLSITHDDSIILIGSCFAENIYKHLVRSRFKSTLNPHGIIFNPESMAIALQDVMENVEYTMGDLKSHQSQWLSLNHHGRFNNSDAQIVLKSINESISNAHDALKNASLLMITWGSAWGYRFKENNMVVANCHKIPQKEFEKELITHEQILSRWTKLISALKQFNPALNVVISISPVRYWRDGVTGNQLSKANLIIAANELTKQFGSVYYFPAYEIVLDELRDYRFYKDDMLHPSELAIAHIWAKFSRWAFHDVTVKKMEQMEPLLRFLEHTPLHSSSEAYELLIKQKESEISRLLDQK